MRQKICLLILFASILCITNNVFATDYTTLKCGKKYWDLYDTERCNSSSDNSAKFVDAAISINYQEDGNIVLTKLSKDAFLDDGDNVDKIYNNNPNIFYTIEVGKPNSGMSENGSNYYYDFNLLADYYKETKVIPTDVVVLSYDIYSTTHNYYYIFAVSELQLLAKYGNKDYELFYFSRDENEDLSSLKNSCADLTVLKNKLEANMNKFGATDEEVKYEAESLSLLCDNYIAHNKETSNACYNDCKKIRASIREMGVDVYNDTNSCGFGEKMVAWLIRVLKLLRFIVPILVIVLSTFEYVSAMMAADDDAFKKVGARFSKRLFIMILFFVLPSLLQFIFNVFNVDGLNSSNPYCLK